MIICSVRWSNSGLRNGVRPHYANLAEPVFPDHDHGGGVEFAVAHELAADGLASGLVAGG